MTAPPSLTWTPTCASSWGLPFSGEGARPPWTGLDGDGALEFTAQSLVEKKAFSGKSSLQGSREEGEGERHS